MRYKSIKEGIPMGQKALNTKPKRNYSMGFELEMYVSKEAFFNDTNEDDENIIKKIEAHYGISIPLMMLTSDILQYIREIPQDNNVSLLELLTKFDFDFDKGFDFAKIQEGESLLTDPKLDTLWNMTESDITSGKISLEQLSPIFIDALIILTGSSGLKLDSAIKLAKENVEKNNIDFFIHNLNTFKERIKREFLKTGNISNSVRDKTTDKIINIDYYISSINTLLKRDPYGYELKNMVNNFLNEIVKYGSFDRYLEKNEDAYQEYETSIIDDFADLSNSNSEYDVSKKYHDYTLSKFEEVINVDRVYKDGSLVGDNGVEVVSEPYNTVEEGLRALEAAFDQMQYGDFYTDHTTGLHVTFGKFSKEEIKKIDWLKFFLIIHGDRVLDQFDRSTNEYSNIGRIVKALREFIPEQNEKYFDAIRQVNHEITYRATKYDFINLSKLPSGLIEFRAMGNEDYETKFGMVKENILRFVRALDIASDPNAYRKEYLTKLQKLVNKNTEILSSPNSPLNIDSLVQSVLKFKGSKIDRFKVNRYNSASLRPEMFLNEIIQEIKIFMDLIEMDEDDTIEKTAFLINKLLDANLIKLALYADKNNKIPAKVVEYEKYFTPLITHMKENPSKYSKLEKFFRILYKI